MAQDDNYSFLLFRVGVQGTVMGLTAGGVRF